MTTAFSPAAVAAPNRLSLCPSLRHTLLARTALVSVAVALTQATATPALAANLAPNALPSGGQVTVGKARISQTETAMTIQQSTPKAVLTWQSFDIGAGASVVFNQPDAGSMALNRVIAANPSVILGKLSANGQIILINPNGVVFGAGSTVNVGGLVASTLNVTDNDFLADHLQFQRGDATGKIVNKGSIHADKYAALISPKVTNKGLIEATLGTVALASGDKVTLTLAGDRLVSLQVEPAAVDSLIKNGGILRADNGKVLLTAEAADKLYGGAINSTGIIEASSLTSTGGQIGLSASGPITLVGATLNAQGATGGGSIVVGDAATASVSVDAKSSLNASAGQSGKGGHIVVNSQKTTFRGTAQANGGKTGGDGGLIETSGHSLDVETANVTAKSTLGRPGTWLLDPTDLTVDDAAANTIQNTLNSGTGVTLQTTASGSSGPGIANAAGAGDITINAPFTWNTNTILTLDAYRSVQVNANITASGIAGGLNVTYNDGGSGGNLLTGAGAAVTLAGSNASLTINGQGFLLVRTFADLQAIGYTSPIGANYALVNDIDAKNALFTPIGANTDDWYNQTFDGLGHKISNLQLKTVSLDGWTQFGLFRSIAANGVIRNLGLVGASTAPGAGNGGVLTQHDSGLVINVYSTGTINCGDYCGGLVGVLGGNSIVSSYSSVTVNGGSAIGGLVGETWPGYSGAIISSYATGAVNSNNGSNVGGLVGSNDWTHSIVSSYALGSVNSNNNAKNIGGLAGYNSGFISSSYAKGAVTAGTTSSAVGGLVGNNFGTLSSSYWDITASGQTKGAGFGTQTGVTGLTDAQAKTMSSYSGFDFTNTWIPGVNTYPMLKSLPLVLNVSINNASKTYGSVNPTFTGSITGFRGDDTASMVQGLTLQSASTTSSNAGNYAITGSGAAAVNNGGQSYLINYLPGALTINPAALTITAANASMTYGGSVPNFTASYTGFVNGDSVSSLTTPVSLAATGNSHSNAGTYAITASGAASPNYVITYNPATLTINPAPLTITANASMTYGGNVPSLPASSYSGFVNGDGVSSLTTPANLTSTGNSHSNAGQYSAVASGATSHNYAITYLPGALTINPAALTITAANASMTYGGTVPSFTASYAGFVNGDSVGSLTTPVSLTSTGNSHSNAGTYAITASGASSRNYAITYKSGTLTINPAALTITAGNTAMTYGGSVPSFTASYAGFVNGDSVGSLTTPVSLTSTGNSHSNAGTYAITASGAASRNYAITYKPGTLTINPALLTIAVNNASMVYGGSVPTLSVNYTGFVNGDGVSSLATAPVLAVNMPTKPVVGTYANALTAAGASARNYKITYAAGTLKITPRPVTWSVASVTSKYGTLPSLGQATLSGILSGDSLGVSLGIFSGSTQVALATTTPIGSYSEKVTGLTGASAANYMLATSGNTPGTLTIYR